MRGNNVIMPWRQEVIVCFLLHAVAANWNALLWLRICLHCNGDAANELSDKRGQHSLSQDPVVPPVFWLYISGCRPFL